MRRILGTLLLMPVLLGLLAGCGDDTDTVSDPERQPSPEPSSTALEYDVLAIVSETAAGGEVSEQLAPVSEPDELSAFLEQFENDGLRQEISAEVEGHETSDGSLVYAAVVAIGCDVPPGVTVEVATDAYLVRPEKVVKPHEECFAPVTSVAVISVPSM
jgi:hypothetical protein